MTLSIVIITAMALSFIISALVGLIGVRHSGLLITPLNTSISLITLRIMLISMLGVAVYMALAAVLATMTRSPLLGFALSLLVFIVDMFFGSMLMSPPPILKYLLYFNLSYLTTVPEGYNYPMFGWKMMAIVAGYGLLFLFGMIVAFKRQRIYE